MANDSATFLKELFFAKPEDDYVLFWTLPEKKSYWVRRLDDATKLAQSMSKHDLYIGVGLSRTDFGVTRRCASNDITGIFGLAADLDLKSDVHNKKSLAATIEEALKILPPNFPPTFVIRTGNGAHAWWLFKEPLMISNEEERIYAIKLSERWQSLLQANAAAHGWAWDRLADLARLLRVPGTSNCKEAGNSKPVEIIGHNKQRYNPSDFEELLDRLGVDRIVTPGLVPLLEGLHNTPLQIESEATFPKDLLDHHLARDSRFAATWKKQRSDMQDQSQSGYDLALANFGFSAGLSPQPIVDLIIHHRRIHGVQQCKALDYYNRTLSKARRSHEETTMNTQRMAAESAFRDTAPPELATPVTRALKCGQISQLLGVRVLKIIKITGKEPTYQLELEAGRVEFASIAKFSDQKSMRLTIASSTDQWIPKMSPKQWELVVQMMMGALTIVDGGEETEFEGAARLHLRNYLTDVHFLDADAVQTNVRSQGPVVIDGQITICLLAFLRYLNKNGESYSTKIVASMLTAIGCVNKRPKSGCIRDQSRWYLPQIEFAPDNYLNDCEEPTGV